jgi:probable F420-dependent oxidoreductase
MKKVKTCGLLAYNYGREELLELARHAERLGYDAIWFGEHYLIPGTSTSVHPAGAVATIHRNAGQTPAQAHKLPDTPIYDPWTQAGMVAAVTSRLKIGTAVCVVPINNPLLLARQTITAHDMSAGRLMFGAGAGWLKEEFDAVGVPFEERGSRFDESLEILRKAWAGGYFEHQGRHHAFGPIRISPTPARIPLVCGGNSPRAVRRAATFGDAWMNSGTATPQQAIEMRAAIEAARAARGADSRPFDYYVRPGSAELEKFEPYIDAGFENFVISSWASQSPLTLAEKLKTLEDTARRLRLS